MCRQFNCTCPRYKWQQAITWTKFDKELAAKDQLFEDIQTTTLIVTIDIFAKVLHCSLDEPVSVQDNVAQVLSRSYANEYQIDLITSSLANHYEW